MSTRLWFKGLFWLFVFVLWALPAVAQDVDTVLSIPSTPHIISTSPTKNQLNVVANTNISVTFDVDMNLSTINNSTFIVNSRSTGRHSGTIAYDGLTKTATLNPTQDFAAGEAVTVVLTTGIKSSGGTPLEKSHTWSFTVITNYYGGTFGFEPESQYPVDTSPFSIFAADLDGDGDLDLTTANYHDHTVSVVLNNGNATFSPSTEYPVISGAAGSIFAADLDADGDIDLATANHAGNTISVLLNNGNATFSPSTEYSVGGSNPHSIFAADLDGDGDLDLATANYGSHNVSVLLNNGDATFSPSTEYSIGVDNYCSSVFAADLDGDGDLDLATANREGKTVSILLNNGDAAFGSFSEYSVGGNEPYSVFVADLDADADLDLVTANPFGDNVSVLLNNGDATFSSSTEYSAGAYPNFVFAADLDSDGDLDLATANPDVGIVSVLLNNGNATFSPHTEYPVNGIPWSVFAADLDGDGNLDLATANGDDGTVSVLISNFLAPKVVSTSPAQNELNVPVNTNISVTFDTDINPGMLNASSFVVHATSTGRHQGTITYDSQTKTATFNPAEDFIAGELVTVVLTTDILEKSYIW
ncbi:MAG: FG-GAP-like repeat-containing protein, partial [candidate division Zixibacteria bacterium]|nr:FG-GAP-like repeat-containing protein [candidate division Zixibacteria bacterium]